uniref:Uncharacterized protein n=1 Tax=Rousettus aegyptiacus TaxID=9407 RepID=A0A7J8HSM8_ROUAE|nr:hypothetical protein HJG63_011133 [Rousettus aegyptiacus]
MASAVYAARGHRASVRSGEETEGPLLKTQNEAVLGLRTCCCCGRRHFPALRSSLVQKMPLVQKMWVRHCGPAGMPQLCWDLARRALAVTSASGTSVSPPQRPWAPAFSLVRLSPVTPRGQGTGGLVRVTLPGF